MDSQTITKRLIDVIREVVPELENQPIGREDSMAALGLDSMERGDVLVSILEALALNIAITQLHGPKNIGELADLIYAKASQ